MNSVELRTIVHTALNQKAGTQYGDILTVEALPPTPGRPVRLRVTVPDPHGNPRVHVVSIEEEPAAAPPGEAFKRMSHTERVARAHRVRTARPEQGGSPLGGR